MKTSTSILCILFGLLLATSQTQAQSQTDINDFIGTWEYTSQEAPYEYQEGRFLIAEKDGEPTVKVLFSNNEEVQAENVKLEDQQLRFDIYVENEYVTVQLECIEEDKITGVADTSDGEIALTAVRE